MIEFICEYFWFIFAIASILSIVIGFGKGLWQYAIKPLFKTETKKDIRELNWTVDKKKRTIWIGHMFK